MHDDLGHVPRGGEREVPRSEAGPGGQDPVAGTDVLAPAPHRPAELRGDVQLHPGRPAVGQLDRNDGVGAVRHRGAGHDPQRRAPAQDVVRRVPRGDVAVDREGDGGLRGGAGELGGAHGVPVHRRVVEARQVDGGDDVLGEHEPQRRPDRDGRRRQRPDEVEHGGAVLRDRTHQTRPSRWDPSGMVRTPPVTRTSPVHTTSAPNVASASTTRLEQPRIDGTPDGKRSSNPSTSL